MSSMELEGGCERLTLLCSWQLRVNESLKAMFPSRGYRGQAHLQIKKLPNRRGPKLLQTKLITQRLYCNSREITSARVV